MDKFIWNLQQRLWRLRRDPGLDLTVKDGIGDHLVEKGVTSQEGVILCRTEMNWNSFGLRVGSKNWYEVIDLMKILCRWRIGTGRV